LSEPEVIARKPLTDSVDTRLRKGWDYINGTPAGFFLESRSGYAGSVQTAIDVVTQQIESIHNLPQDVPKISMHYQPALDDGAQFVVATKNSGEDYRFIEIGDFKLGLYNTVAHELGHFLDWGDIGTSPRVWSSGGTEPYSPEGEAPDFASEVMQDWLKVAYASPEIVALQQALDKGISGEEIIINGVRVPQDDIISFYKYLLEPGEVWARSYAQFIARESGNSVMLDELQQLQNELGTTTKPVGVDLINVWSDESFAPLQEAVRGVLEAVAINV
jgi:hypothetical protein